MMSLIVRFRKIIKIASIKKNQTKDQHGLSSQANNCAKTNENYITNYNNSIVLFDVGGRIFKVRRSVVEAFPDTVLAQSLSDLLLSSASSTSLQKQQQPIFIDRDSHRFSYVLDYMRDNCTVELPITISKKSFLRELKSFGFDIISNSSRTVDCISCAIPTYDAVMQVDKLHSNFCSNMKQMELEKNYTILAYACFCEFVYHRTVHCTFRANNSTNNNNNDTPSFGHFGCANNSTNNTNKNTPSSAFGQQPSTLFGAAVQKISKVDAGQPKLLPSMTSTATQLPENLSSLLSSLSMYTIAKSVALIYEQHKDCTTYYTVKASTAIPVKLPTTSTTNPVNTSNTSTGSTTINTISNINHNKKISLFDKCLSEYGFHCKNVQYCSISYSVSIHLKQI